MGHPCPLPRMRQAIWVHLQMCIACQDDVAEMRQPLRASHAATSLWLSRRSTFMAAAQLLCLNHSRQDPPKVSRSSHDPRSVKSSGPRPTGHLRPSQYSWQRTPPPSFPETLPGKPRVPPPRGGGAQRELQQPPPGLAGLIKQRPLGVRVATHWTQVLLPLGELLKGADTAKNTQVKIVPK